MRKRVLLLFLCFSLSCSRHQPQAEILWDTWGVPHIFARDADSLFHAFGYAQARSHGDLILRLYGEARGRAAEYWGKQYLASDRWVRTMGIPQLAAEWWKRQPARVRGFLEAFTAGVNDYVRRHPGKIDPTVKVVLPVTPTDVLAHVIRVIHCTFVVSRERVAYEVKSWHGVGSNAWAIGPSHSANGHAMLLMNPHLPWSGFFLWYEAQLTAPGINAYGAALVGQPLLGVAFNDHLGWTHTVNTFDGADLYELTLNGNGYRWNGARKAFQTRVEILKVRQPDGTLKERKLVVRRSVQGPVVGEKKGKALALRIVGLHQTGLVGQYWDMMRAKNLAEFEKADSRLQMPMFTVMYADTAGHILHVFGGRTPIRPKGDWAYWHHPVPGDTSATLWTRTFPYQDLPRVLDPPSGWLQNANDPPWTTTFPRALDPDQFPAYLAPRGMSFRAQRSVRMLASHPRIGFQQMIRYAQSTRMELADRILGPLLKAAEKGPAAARQGARILARWDRCAEADSRGAVLFQEFVRQWQRLSGPRPLFAEPWSPDHPRTTPRGLASPRTAVAALAAAVRKVEKQYGAADVAWGKVYRLKMGALDLPGVGGPGTLGIFHVTNYRHRIAMGGDSFVAVVEFSQPVRARVLLSYGNSSQPGSPHHGDQLRLYASKQLRPVWRSRAAIEAHLESRTTF